MRDGSLLISFNEGKVVESSIGAGLDDVYERIFLKLKGQNKKDENIDDNVILFLCGCFMLEAAINKTLESIILKKISTEKFKSSLWNIVRSQNIPNKLDIIVSCGKKNHHSELQKNLEKIKKLFSLRNKMVHFYENSENLKDLSISGIDDIEQLNNIVTNYPEHKLIQELKGVKLNNKIKLICFTKQKLDKISGTKSFRSDNDKKQ